MLDLPLMKIRQKAELIKAYFSLLKQPQNDPPPTPPHPILEDTKVTKDYRMEGGKIWMGQAGR